MCEAICETTKIFIIIKQVFWFMEAYFENQQNVKKIYSKFLAILTNRIVYKFLTPNMLSHCSI